MWIKPSNPPRSTKAPNGHRLVTWPVWTCPGSRLASSAVSWLLSRAMRSERIRRHRLRSISTTRTARVSLIRAARPAARCSCDWPGSGLISCEAGTKPCRAPKSANSPPRLNPETLTSAVPLLANNSSARCQSTSLSDPAALDQRRAFDRLAATPLKSSAPTCGRGGSGSSSMSRSSAAQYPSSIY